MNTRYFMMIQLQHVTLQRFNSSMSLYNDSTAASSSQHTSSFNKQIKHLTQLMRQIAQYAAFWMTRENYNFKAGRSRLGSSGNKHKQEKGSDKISFN
jgi:hypothetical protein